MADQPATFSLDELRAAAVPEFFQRDTAEIKKSLVAKFEAETGRTLYPAQTEMFFIDLLTYAVSMLAEGAQAAVLQNRAIWATGQHLDEVGANVSTYRLKAQAAQSNVRFTLSAIRATAVIIAQGTRVSAGSDLIFTTAKELVIAAGNLTGDVDVTADQAGEAYNDLQLGQIEDILDPVAFVSGVANVLISDGGADIESDDRFRIRIANAFERLSKGGSRQGYIENVRAVSALISDVQVIRTQPGYIEITPLMIDGISSDLMDAEILAYLDAETMIPMGDYVSISKATEVTFDVVMTLKVAPGMAGAVQDQAEGIIRDRFSEWRLSLGAQIAPTALVEAVRAIAGVVGVTGPAFNFTDLPSTSFAGIGLVTVNIQEVENV